MVAILGFAGGFNTTEISNLRTRDIVDNGSTVLVNVSSEKRNKTFLLNNETPEGSDMLKTCKKYMALRPAIISHDRFLIYLRKNGECTTKPVGVHTIAKVPAQIAKYFKKNPEEYTGRSFKRTATSLRTLVENVL